MMLSVRPGSAVSGVGIWPLELMSPIRVLKCRQMSLSLGEVDTIDPQRRQ